MPVISGLRSPHAVVDRLVYVGRMFDKIRLHHRGELPVEFHAALSKGLDLRTTTFLNVDYHFVRERVLTGGSDEAILADLFARGGGHSDHDCTVWNAFLQKLGWRDDRSEFLQNRVAAAGFEGNAIETFFDLIEHDEQRPFGEYVR
jgi:hypothetical protein